MPKETFGREKLSSNGEDEFRAILKWGEYDAQLGVETDAPLRINGVEYDSIWYTFDTREDFNRMIRALRKARDKVFGADE